MVAVVGPEQLRKKRVEEAFANETWPRYAIQCEYEWRDDQSRNDCFRRTVRLVTDRAPHIIVHMDAPMDLDSYKVLARAFDYEFFQTFVD